MSAGDWKLELKRLRFLVVALLLAAPTISVWAQNDNDYDAHKIRVSAYWFYSNPSGNVQGSDETDSIDLSKDLGFDSYSTITGKIDWKFTHKNHLYLVGSNYNQTRQRALDRTIEFQGQTFNVGASVKANLSAPELAPGYELRLHSTQAWPSWTCSADRSF